jgi:enamine deaminase RidA (YjgF/YER057c/UK114 family)
MIGRRTFLFWACAALSVISCSAFKRRRIDPWGGWDQYAALPAIEIENPRRMLMCSGLCAPTKDGRSILPLSDVAGQMAAAFDQVEELLRAANFSLADATQFNIYTLNVDAVMASDVIVKRLKAAGVAIPGTIIGVTGLAFKDQVIELEMTAMK